MQLRALRTPAACPISLLCNVLQACNHPVVWPGLGQAGRSSAQQDLDADQELLPELQGQGETCPALSPITVRGSSYPTTAGDPLILQEAVSVIADSVCPGTNCRASIAARNQRLLRPILSDILRILGGPRLVVLADEEGQSKLR